MNKITFVNNTSPLLSAENLNAIQDNTEDAIDEVVNSISPSCLYCRPSTDINLTNNYVQPLWEELIRVGDGITISNGTITIGAGVNHVKITAKWYLSTGGSNAGFYHYILKNGTSVGNDWLVESIPSSTYRPTSNQAVAEVEEGDVISASLYGAGISMNHLYSTLIIEKID